MAHFYTWHFKLCSVLHELNAMVTDFMGYCYVLGVPVATLSIYMLLKVMIANFNVMHASSHRDESTS
jgi:hypothetical protein